MREDDRTGVSETRPDRQYRMPAHSGHIRPVIPI